MEIYDPGLGWYLSISKENALSPRCSFATADRCPRFFQSLSLLGEAGSTSIDPKENQRLLKKWSKSDLWPLTSEQATAISGPDGNFNSFIRFCPEVSFERFGYFASSLHRYADEIDTDFAHKKLAEEEALPNDYRWAWSYVTPTHYTICPLYSLLNSETQGSKITFDRVERFFKWARSHPIVSIIIILVIIIFAIGTLSDSFSKSGKFYNQFIKILSER